ncbi:DUF2231 domain-containing protein [Actinoplanes sp. NBRC 101535]|uniref:DUF2231 domain-containing protein n=1 Tax=Actinoplanes sp. NBRC 101535 TaxID=3032196 RepID=UPI0024A4B682|nr:DUF2231 domain-containing protein [Actinoplanes sp. NBRC 101535]GLY05900.1 hypothetical protein Acsp01_62790 [Actinoplanes sp. NBRC 101535]
MNIAGQAVQPILVMFPLGLFAMAAMFDIADLMGGPSILGALAYWNVIAGLFIGVMAILAGAVDVMFMRMPEQRRLGVLRGLLSMGVLVIFAVIAMLRVHTPERVVGGGLLMVELLALTMAGFGAWFIGRLAVGRAPAFARAATGNRTY